MIPRVRRREFFEWMAIHEPGDVMTDQWIVRMTDAAREFLDEHGIKEEPRAAVVYYCKSIGRKDGQADI